MTSNSGGGGGGVTYRVVHINSASSSGAGASHNTSSPALINSALHLPSTTASQMAYITTTGAGSAAATCPDVAITSANGFYVIGGSHASSVLQAGTAGGAGSDGGVNDLVTELPRDHRRRATHNEVERRRRVNINNWISKLAKILPDPSGSGDLTKNNMSKGAVLAQACDFISECRHYRAKYADAVRDNEKLLDDIKLLKQSNEALVTANQLLKAHLKTQGTLLIDSSDSHSAH